MHLCSPVDVGVLQALMQGFEGRFNERLEQALKMDPSYDNAGALIAKGRYYFLAIKFM